MTPLTREISGVTYPLYVLLNDKDTTTPIRRSVISNTTDVNAPNPGPGQLYAAMVIEDQPDFDPDFSNSETIEQYNAKTGTWDTTYLISDKPKEEVLKIAENRKRQQVGRVVPGQDFTEINTSLLAAIIRVAKLELTPDEQVLADAVLLQGGMLANNRAKLAAVKADIDAGGKPDLKAIDWDGAAASIGPIGIRLP